MCTVISPSATKNLVPGKIFKPWVSLRLIWELFSFSSARVNNSDDVTSQRTIQMINFVPIIFANLQQIYVIVWKNVHKCHLQFYLWKNYLHFKKRTFVTIKLNKREKQFYNFWTKKEKEITLFWMFLYLLLYCTYFIFERISLVM